MGGNLTPPNSSTPIQAEHLCFNAWYMLGCYFMIPLLIKSENH